MKFTTPLSLACISSVPFVSAYAVPHFERSLNPENRNTAPLRGKNGQPLAQPLRHEPQQYSARNLLSHARIGTVKLHPITTPGSDMKILRRYRVGEDLELAVRELVDGLLERVYDDAAEVRNCGEVYKLD